jgi:hypothetical protein
MRLEGKDHAPAEPTERRQADRRAHLDLQVDLLAERS